jgi:hypothetical protein
MPEALFSFQKNPVQGIDKIIVCFIALFRLESAAARPGILHVVDGDEISSAATDSKRNGMFTGSTRFLFIWPDNFYGSILQ